MSLQEIADFQESEHSLSIDKTNRLYRVSLYANDAGRGMRKIQKEFVRIFQEKIRTPPFNIVGEERLKKCKR